MKQWKGRFSEPLDRRALAFSSSLEVDRRLADEDIRGSLAHVEMLAAQKILPRADARKITRALKEIRRELGRGTPAWLRVGDAAGRFVAEDVHMAIEQRLIEKTGEVGGRLHTARSRNDQIALDERLYLRRTIEETVGRIRALQRALCATAEAHKHVLMPGYTHLQRAQPVLLAHHLLAYVEMLDRDRERFLDCRKRVNLSPLGAAALAGTSFPIDRRRVARDLGFEGIIANSMDAVSDRDALLEFLSAASITMMHLSRFSEELILWTTQEWRFATIGDAFATGSSIMPQKKNPDMAELIRGKTGRVYGDLIALLTVMKGLPLSYNRDLQEDKEPLFDAADTVSSSLEIMARMVATVTFAGPRFEEELNGDILLATELADYLVRKGMPFRRAHGVVADVIAVCQDRGCSLLGLPLRDYRRASSLFEEDIVGILRARASILLKRSEGSTSPKEVARALQRWNTKFRKKDPTEGVELR